MLGQVEHPLETEEQQWLLAAQRGDKDAFGDIVRCYHRLIVSVAYRVSGDATLADDVAQDTFIKAWQRLPGFQPERESSLRAWLCRIAHNRTVDLLRKNRPQTELDPRQHDRQPQPDQQALRNETAAEVQAAILRLPEAVRTTLVLREYEDMSYEEIAAVLNIPIGTVMSRLHSARQRLAKELVPLLANEAKT